MQNVCNSTLFCRSKGPVPGLENLKWQKSFDYFLEILASTRPHPVAVKFTSISNRYVFAHYRSVGEAESVLHAFEHHIQVVVRWADKFLVCSPANGWWPWGLLVICKGGSICDGDAGKPQRVVSASGTVSILPAVHEHSGDQQSSTASSLSNVKPLPVAIMPPPASVNPVLMLNDVDMSSALKPLHITLSSVCDSSAIDPSISVCDGPATGPIVGESPAAGSSISNPMANSCCGKCKQVLLCAQQHFCHSCGSKQATPCPDCSALPLVMDQPFCHICGGKFGAV